MRTQFKVDGSINIDIRPFGIFNRFLVEGSEDIYLENGMIDLGNMGFRNPEAYKPCTLYTNAEQCPINGNVILIEENNPASDPGGCPKPISLGKIKYDITFSQKYINGIESRVFGCKTKISDLTMIDPRGPGKDCYSYYQPSIPTVYPTIIPSLGVGGMIEVFLSTTEAYLAQRAASVSNTVCRQRDASIANYKADAPLYCGEELILKKYSAREFPGSVFSGKLRLYAQSIQGSILFDFQLNDTGFGLSYKISLKSGNPGESFRPAEGAPGELRERSYELNGRVHAMFRDSMYNYYLVNTTNWTFSYLEPNKSGRKLRNYLREKGPSLPKKEEMAYEAYLLSCCLPTRTAATNPNMQFEVSGSPFPFGWHGNWNGDRLARVGIGGIQNHARSAIHQATIELDTVSMFEEELRRKKENLLRQKKTEDFALGNCWVYYTAASLSLKEGLSSDFNDMDPDNYCVIGDIEEGAWFFMTKKDSTEENAEGDQKAAEQNNKQYGGYVMSKEFYETFNSYAVVSGEESDYAEFQFRGGKVYSWDEFQGAYYYHNLDYTNPRKPATFEGDFEVPLYCWFDKDDRLKVLNYYEVGTTNFDNISERDPDDCSAAFSKNGYTKTYNSGTYYHGFSVSPAGVEDKAYRGGVYESFYNYTGTESEFDSWEWMCPPVVISCPNPELTDWSLEVASGLGPSCKGWWWGSLGQSVSTSTYRTSSDSNSGSSFFIVPKSDAECAVFGHMDTITSSKSYSFQAYYGTNNLQMWWCIGLYSNSNICRYFAPDFDCKGWYYYAFNADRVFLNIHKDPTSWTYDYATGIAANRAVGSVTPMMGISEFTNGSWGNYSLWKMKKPCKTRLYGPNQSFADLKYYDGVFTPTDNWYAQNADDHIMIANDHKSEITTYYVGTAYLAGKGSLHTIEMEHKYKNEGDFGEFYKFADGPPDPIYDPYIYSHFNVRSGLQNNSLIFGSTQNKDRMPVTFPYRKGQIFVGYA